MLGKVLRDRLIRAITRPPFRDELGRKGRFERIARAGAHLIRRLRLVIDGWPRWSHPLRVLFLSDFHTGSHSDDVARLEGIVAEARAFNPDLVLLGGDFVNMQLFGAGRVPPKVIAAVCSRGSMHCCLTHCACMPTPSLMTKAGALRSKIIRLTSCVFRMA